MAGNEKVEGLPPSDLQEALQAGIWTPPIYIFAASSMAHAIFQLTKDSGEINPVLLLSVGGSGIALGMLLAIWAMKVRLRRVFRTLNYR